MVVHAILLSSIASKTVSDLLKELLPLLRSLQQDKARTLRSSNPAFFSFCSQMAVRIKITLVMNEVAASLDHFMPNKRSIFFLFCTEQKAPSPLFERKRYEKQAKNTYIYIQSISSSSHEERISSFISFKNVW